jgi:hypothetical protein
LNDYIKELRNQIVELQAKIDEGIGTYTLVDLDDFQEQIDDLNEQIDSVINEQKEITKKYGE